LQVTSSDKLLQLDNELFTTLELVKNVIQRETYRQEVMQQSQTVWEKGVTVADMKRGFLSLGTKEDKELLHDKERVLKRPKNDSHHCI
jgi:enhancer of polycomb-like protein